MLKLSSHNPQHACVIHITDTHLMANAESRFVGMNPEQSFHAVMQDVLARHRKIDAIIHTGDLAQEACPETYTRYLNYMQRFAIPFFQVPGNHDAQDCFPFSQTAPQQPLLLELGQWCIVLLNSAVAGRIDGSISAEQLGHLSEVLAQCGNRPTLLACHHHPMLMQSAWIDAHCLKNAADLRALLAQSAQVKALICGHVHQDSAQQWQHFQCLSTPSTCVQFKPRSEQFALDACPAGYRLLELHHDGQWHSQVYRLNALPEGLAQQQRGY